MIAIALLFVTFFLTHTVQARDIMLSAGIGGYTPSKLQNLYNGFNNYAESGIITASSILVYEIGHNGYLVPYNTSDPNISSEDFQKLLKANGLKAYPCVYCDETIGNCEGLAARIAAIYSHLDVFIADSIMRAEKYGWDGYTIDFEPASDVNSTQITTIALEWAKALQRHNLVLNVWIGRCTVYDMTALYNTNLTNMVIMTMETYVSSYGEFIQSANNELIMIDNETRLGYGLLTLDGENVRHNSQYEEISENDMIQIGKWSALVKSNSLSIWASHIPPKWFNGLKIYLTTS